MLIDTAWSTEDVVEADPTPRKFIELPPGPLGALITSCGVCEAMSFTDPLEYRDRSRSLKAYIATGTSCNRSLRRRAVTMISPVVSSPVLADASVCGVVWAKAGTAHPPPASAITQLFRR